MWVRPLHVHYGSKTGSEVWQDWLCNRSTGVQQFSFCNQTWFRANRTHMHKQTTAHNAQGSSHANMFLAFICTKTGPSSVSLLKFIHVSAYLFIWKVIIYFFLTPLVLVIWSPLRKENGSFCITHKVHWTLTTAHLTPRHSCALL